MFNQQQISQQYQFQSIDQSQKQTINQPNHFVLPPITSILQNFPTFQLPLYSEPNNESINMENITMDNSNTGIMGNMINNNEENNIFLNDKNLLNSQENNQPTEKTPQYTLADDLLILKTINSYYGAAFHGRVPWSFWQTFRKVTGNKRSPSSLYHHWNGAMKRKYGSFLNHGKINECISWIETAMESGKPAQKENSDNEFSGMPLAHNWSYPPLASKK